MTSLRINTARTRWRERVEYWGWCAAGIVTPAAFIFAAAWVSTLLLGATP